MPTPLSMFPAASAAAVAALALFAAGPAAAQAKVVGEVGAVSGLALAQAPGQEVRTLSCGDPIYAGDLIVTGEASSLGILSGDFWAGLGADTEMVFDETAGGAPRLDLEEGHIRLIDASAAAPVPAAIYTPGLVALDAGRDTEALAFPEKVGTVAMICGWDDPLAVSAAGTSTGSLRTQPGGCAVGKPKEAVFGAPATHAALPVNADMACGADRAFDVAGRQFLPDVAARAVAAVSAGPPPFSPTVSPAQGPVYVSCQLAPCAAGAAVRPTGRGVVTPPPVGFPPPRPGNP